MVDGKVKVDGVIKEWQALSKANVGAAGEPKAEASFAIQYDATNMYLAGDVSGLQKRTAAFADKEDKVTLVLAFPDGRGFSVQRVELLPGKPGESPGSVRLGKGREVSGAKLVEAPRDGGYTFEAAIPWAALGSKEPLGLRALIRFERGSTSLATGEGSESKPASLPALLTEPEIAVAEGLLNPKGLSQKAPSFDVIADVAGGDGPERIAAYDNFITVCGPKYREGKQFFFRDVGGSVVGLEAKQVLGQKHHDLIVRKRISTGNSARDVVEIWSFQGDEPQTVFAHELAIVQGDRKLLNSVRFKKDKLEVSVDPASNWDRANFNEPRNNDAISLILPWQTPKSQTFAISGGKIVAEGAAPKDPEGTPTKPDGAGPDRKPEPRDLPTPKVAAGGDLGQKLFAEFKRSRGHADTVTAKADLSVSVAEDPRPERVVLMDRDLVVFGPGFREGTRYEFLTLGQFEKGSDIGELTAKDLNGDGAAELILKGTRHAKTSTDTVDIDVVFIYSVTKDGIKRIFAAETARAIGAKRIQGVFQLVPAGKSFEIDLQAGTAKGFDKKSYPFQEETQVDGIEAVLLPWGQVKARRFAWDGTRFGVKK
jgi:hypothetical protein